jgi:hypothetical protein
MSGSGKTPGHSGRWALPATLVRAIGDHLFRDDDARARRHGWQVTSGHGGLSRTYRDPRFDLLQACPACSGSGHDEQDRECDRCAGTGRITLAERLSLEAGRAR